jgi:hypothetical protein
MLTMLSNNFSPKVFFQSCRKNSETGSSWENLILNIVIVLGDPVSDIFFERLI